MATTKKYWWEKLKVVRQKPAKKKANWDGPTPQPCVNKPMLKVPCYLEYARGVDYLYEVRKSAAGWYYIYTSLELADPKWSCEKFEVMFKRKPETITKKEALAKLKKHPNAEKILR